MKILLKAAQHTTAVGFLILQSEIYQRTFVCLTDDNNWPWLQLEGTSIFPQLSGPSFGLMDGSRMVIFGFNRLDVAWSIGLQNINVSFIVVITASERGGHQRKQ